MLYYAPKLTRRVTQLSLYSLSILLLSAAAQKPINKQSFQEILSNYLFINDFYPKEETRKNSDELFWKYDLKLPKVEFEILFDLADKKAELPATPGSGREYEHLNLGRQLYLEGKYEEAKKVWLTGRQTFGKNYPMHRRNDYFISLAFLQLAKQTLTKNPSEGFANLKAKSDLANAATFLSWALVVKKDTPDPLIDVIAPRGFYNLASIYFRYNRYAAAYGAAEEGLNYLRKTGRKDHRPELRRIIAEGQLQNMSYLEAVKELDTAIRQDPDPNQAAAMFRRVGDIYFSLNNYELAEENYSIANKINEDVGYINPAQYVLRGESLFWLGNFKEALNNFRFALSSSGDSLNTAPLDPAYAAIANLRIADSLVAIKDFERAKLEYFRLIKEFHGTGEEAIAKVRSACLELPEYDGNNVKHARELLEAAKTSEKLPNDAVELAWACQVASYTQRERTNDMVERVRTFAYKYPDSRFLNSLISPVKEVKASKIEGYFAQNNPYAAVRYFEQTRAMLFPKVSNDLASRLFTIYVDGFKSSQAAEFYPQFTFTKDPDLNQLRKLAFLSEMSAKDKKWSKAQSKQIKFLETYKWTLEPTPIAYNYVQRIKNSSKSNIHLGWTYELSKVWAKNSQKLICQMVYPLLSQQLEIYPREASRLRQDFNYYLTKIVPDALKTDETCAISMLELELKIYADQPAELASRYVSRAEWPLTKTLSNLFWEVAELNAAKGKPQAAKEIWTILRNKAPKDSPEYEFAKIRLDNSKTEYDGLWR